jgi:hypothetical protein
MANVHAQAMVRQHFVLNSEDSCPVTARNLQAGQAREDSE